MRWFSGSDGMATELTLSVNGAKQVLTVAPDTPLLFVLRNDLKLTGPHLGCGMAQCGACSVLLDGEEVRSCITQHGPHAARFRQNRWCSFCLVLHSSRIFRQGG